MPRDKEFLENVNRTRRNLFKTGGTVGAFALAFLSGLASKKAVATAVVCFRKGTRIMTAEGEQPVEKLEVGSRLPTMFGGFQPIEAVRRLVVRRPAGSRWNEKQLLVKIAAGALARDIPSRDLFVTRSHAIFVDGVLVPAHQLVNGTTVTLFAPDRDEYEVFHVKVESHDIIRAEGAPCETLRDANVDEICAPLLSFHGKRSELQSRMRSALSLWSDRREKVDILRDYLEEHGVYEARPFSN